MASEYTVTIAERLDQIVVRVYQATAINGFVEQAFDLTPGLARIAINNGFNVPAGTVITLPTQEAIPETEVIRLWT